MKRTPTSEIEKCREEYRRLASCRAKLERAILRVDEMIDACLVEQRLGPTRRGPYSYLSRKVDGKTRLTYVKAEELPRVQKLTDRWRAFSRSVAEWVKVSRQIEKALRRLGRLHVVEFQAETRGSRKRS